MTRRTRCGIPGFRKCTAPSCHDGCGDATARTPLQSPTPDPTTGADPSETGTTADPWEYCLYIPNDPRAVTISRRTLRLILTMHGLIRLVDTAELLATELVANAVQHTKGSAALRVRWAAGVLRIGAPTVSQRESRAGESRAARQEAAPEAGPVGTDARMT